MQIMCQNREKIGKRLLIASHMGKLPLSIHIFRALLHLYLGVRGYCSKNSYQFLRLTRKYTETNLKGWSDFSHLPYPYLPISRQSRFK